MLALFAAGSILAAPELPRLPPIQRQPQVTYLDRNGQVLAVRGGRYGPPVNLKAVPAYVPGAFIAIEDRRFYEHNGMDPRGIARAVVTDIVKGRLAEGASTITQQLARNLFLSQERTAERKAKEAIYAIQLERTYSKQQILALYLSRVYFGSGAYGLEAASQRYFGKPAAKLTVREAAMMAAILKAPSDYNPADNPEKSAERSRLVLDAMVETGVISAAQAAKAKAETPRVRKGDTATAAQYFIDWIDDQALKAAGPLKQDIVVETTLDLPMETTAAAAIRNTVARYEDQRVEQAAVVAVDGLGRVRAMVGGVDYVRAPFNRAVEAKRQAGSAWKPFVYLAALEAGRTPETLVVDEPLTLGAWSPRNYEDGFAGPMTMEQALGRSINTVAVRLADEVGRPQVAGVAYRLGIKSTINTDPAMALGTTLVSPLELAQAYGAFSNGGYKVQAYGIERVRTTGGKVLWQRSVPKPASVVGNPALSDLNRMTRYVVAAGTGTKAQIPGRDIAGKTGTTSDYKDAWFAGYSGGFTTVVWVGRDDATAMRRITGSSAPVDIWKTFMTSALKRVPAMAIPPGSPPPAPLPPPILVTDDPAALPPAVAGPAPATQPIPPAAPQPAL